MIHVFLGTKAQYIKTAPVLRQMDKAQIPYNLIDSGQHATLIKTLCKELRVRRPDVRWREGADIATVPVALLWLLETLLIAALCPVRVAKTFFRNTGGICLIHGDTPTTLLSVLLAKRAGVKVAHLEAGLRSYDYLNPFPEEIIRIITMRLSDVLFAPSEWAFENMKAMNLKGKKINLGANTNVEALVFSLSKKTPSLLNFHKYCLSAIHRAETLHNQRRLTRVIKTVLKVARDTTTVFVLHPPTELQLRKYGLYESLENEVNVKTLPLLPHTDFIHLQKNADFVITDGGSIQEESFYLNVPCLLMRKKTERREGLGHNVYLSEFRKSRIDYFLVNWRQFAPGVPEISFSPSKRIVEIIQQYQ